MKILSTEKNKVIRTIFILLIVFFIGWISLFGEPFQSKYRNITFLYLIILLIISFLYKRPQRFTLIDFNLFIYLFFVTLTLPFSENKIVAFDWYTRYILPIPFVYLAMRNTDKKDILLIALSLCLFSSLISLIGILEAIFHKNIIYELWVENIFYHRYIHNTPRIMSTLIHPTVFGSFLLGCLPFSFFLATNIKAPYKLLIKIFIPLIIFGIIFSFSRGNLVGLLVSSSVYLFFAKRKYYIKYILIGLIILILLSSTLVEETFCFKRFSLRDILLYFPGYHKFELPSHSWSKIENCLITLRILKQHPFLGLGLNHYRLKFEKYIRKEFARLKRPEKYEYRIPDNMYLSILAETGLLGFTSFILFLIMLFKKCILLLRKIKNIAEIEFLIACLCGIIGLLISMITYDLLYWLNPLLLFWFLIGSMRAIELSSCI